MYKIREWLYIGKYRESTNPVLLGMHGITAMLHLAEDVCHEGITCLYLGIDDGVPVAGEILKRGIDFICQQKAQGKTVVSVCGAGISRSTTFAIGALMQEESLTWQEAYRTVLDHHPDAMPHGNLIMSLAKQHGIEYTMLTATDEVMEIFMQHRRGS